MLKPCKPVALALALALAAGAAAGGEIAEAEANRKKPLQRCDQLSDKAEIECLKKARERIVEARQKRETASTKGGATPAEKSAAAEKTSAQKGAADKAPAQKPAADKAAPEKVPAK